MAFFILIKLGLFQGETAEKNLVYHFIIKVSYRPRYCVIIGKNVIPVNRSPEHSEGECEESLRSLPLLGTRISPFGRNDKQENYDAVKQSEHNDDTADCRVVTLLAMTFQSIFQSS